MKWHYPIFLAFFLLPVMNCGQGSPTSPRVFTDSLTLGKGFHGIDLTGETYAFTITHSQNQDIFPTIYWRAESQSKMKGAFVELNVVRLAEFGPEAVGSFRFEMTRLDDNVVISSYLHLYGAGKFRAAATLGDERRLLGVKEFTVQ